MHESDTVRTKVLTIGISGSGIWRRSMGKEDSISKMEKTVELRVGISIGMSVNVKMTIGEHRRLRSYSKIAIRLRWRPQQAGRHHRQRPARRGQQSEGRRGWGN
jgi:hypothetical protein